MLKADVLPPLRRLASDSSSPELGMRCAFAIANIASVSGVARAKLRDLGAIATLVKLTAVDENTAHQAARGLAWLFTDMPSISAELAEDVLSAMEAMMRYDNVAIREETCRALAALAKIASLRGSIVRRLLQEIVPLADERLPDDGLKEMAESVLYALGYTGGVGDLTLCSNDVGMMKDMFFMWRAMERQTSLDASLREFSEETWAASAPLRVRATSTPSPRPRRRRLRASMGESSPSIFEKLFCSPSSSYSSVADTTVPVVSGGEPMPRQLGKLSRRSRLLLQQQYSSILQRQLLVWPDLAVPAGPPSQQRSIIMPSRTYFSFRFSRIIHRFIARMESETWNITFRDSEFHGSFVDRFSEMLRGLPSIKSLVFVNAPDGVERDEQVAYIVNALPPWMQWVTFDGVLSKPGLNVLTILSKGRKSFVPGIALRNHGFRLVDLAPFLRLLKLPAARTLRHLDLSGNKLGDAGVADVLRICKGNSTLRALDVSRNEVGRAKETADVLAELLVSNSTLRMLSLAGNGLSSRGAALILVAVAAATGLRALDLSGNSLSVDSELNKCVKENTSLVELNLARNSLSQECGKDLRFSLMFNTTLCFLRLDFNKDLRDEDLEVVEKKLAENRAEAVKAAQQARAEEEAAEAAASAGADGEAGGDAAAEAAAATAAAGAAGDGGEGEEGKAEGSGGRRVSFAADDEEGKAAGSPASKPRLERAFSEEDAPTVSVLFSEPLAYTTKEGELRSMSRLNYDVERELLRQTVMETDRHIKLRFDFATTVALRSVVTMGCRAIHYSGHGSEGGLSFEDGHGGFQLVEHGTLRKLVAAGSGGGEHNSVKFVFVSACYSRSAGEAFVAAGIPHVVCATVDLLLDSAALEFTRAFYKSLAVGDSVQAAFEIGVQAVSASPDLEDSKAESSKFVLLPDGADHSEAIFPVTRKRSPSYRVSRDERGLHLPTTPEDFIGRNIDMLHVIQDVTSRRLVTITGDIGMGKTSLAVAVSNYIAERQMFPDGVHFIRLKGRSTVAALLEELEAALFRKHKEKDEAVGMGVLEYLKEQKCLLVWDYCNDVKRDNGFRVFLGQLLDQTKGVKVLTTSNDPIGGVPGFGENIHRVKGLALEDGARLFLKLCPFHVGLNAELVECLATHPFFLSLRCCPGEIAPVAYSFGGDRGHDAGKVGVADLVAMLDAAWSDAAVADDVRTDEWSGGSGGAGSGGGSVGGSVGAGSDTPASVASADAERLAATAWAAADPAVQLFGMPPAPVRDDAEDEEAEDAGSPTWAEPAVQPFAVGSLEEQNDAGGGGEEGEEGKEGEEEEGGE
eukprot:PLAT12458.18.p1 GENE.PLAT12458.18~~PLAT12458.18.p1  ORF type:complete len:1521 (+),score=744.58 PLAT12458.18:631-4563(+)